MNASRADSNETSAARMRDVVRIADVIDLVRDAKEPFIVPDVTPPGASPSVVFHILRDLVDVDELVHSDDGYWRVIADA